MISASIALLTNSDFFMLTQFVRRQHYIKTSFFNASLLENPPTSLIVISTMTVCSRYVRRAEFCTFAVLGQLRPLQTRIA